MEEKEWSFTCKCSLGNNSLECKIQGKVLDVTLTHSLLLPTNLGSSL